MKEKILAFLKTKLVGVPDNYLTGVAEHYSKTVTEDKQIETTFTDGVIDLLKLNAGLLQSEGDKRVTEATKTALKNFQEKHGLKEDGTPIKKEVKKDVVPNPDEPAWFTAYKEQQKEQNEALNAKLEKQEQEKTLTALSEKVKTHEKLKDIPSTFLEGRNLIPKSEAEIDQLAADIRTVYDKHVQSETEKGAYISIPSTGDGHQEEKETITEYLDDKFPKEPQGKVLIKK